MARACNSSPSEAEVEVLDGEIWELGLGVWVVLPSWCSVPTFACRDHSSQPSSLFSSGERSGFQKGP